MKRASRRASSNATVRAGVFALLVLVHLAPPALALRACEGESGCCCVAPPEPVAAARTGGGCCADAGSRASAGSRDRSARSIERCECRVDPAPAPSPERVVPPRGSQDGDGLSPRTWIRVHADVSARTLWPPTGPDLSPGVTGGRVAQDAGSEDGARVPSAGSWSLARGGVPGLLALLSVARL